MVKLPGRVAMKTHTISASAQVELDPITARPRGHAYADFLEEWAAEMVLQGAPWKKNYRNGWIMVGWLVVWNMNFMTFHILEIVIPTDFHIFQRG